MSKRFQLEIEEQPLVRVPQWRPYFRPRGAEVALGAAAKFCPKTRRPFQEVPSGGENGIVAVKRRYGKPWSRRSSQAVNRGLMCVELPCDHVRIRQPGPRDADI